MPARRKALSLLTFAMSAFVPICAAQAGTFAAAAAGVSLIREEGHAPPLCCRERERWSAPGARLGGEIGYAFSIPLFLRADVGLAVHEVIGEDHLDLTLLAPDAGVYVGAAARWPRLRADLAVGAGWRHFWGTARENGPGAPSPDREVRTGMMDLRLSVGVHALGPRRTIGGELMIA